MDTSSEVKKRRTIAILVPGTVADPEKFLQERISITRHKNVTEFCLQLAPGVDIAGKRTDCSHLLFPSDSNQLVGSISEIVSFTSMPDFAFSHVDPTSHIHPYAISTILHPQPYLPTEPIKGAPDSSPLLNNKWMSGILARFHDAEIPETADAEKVLLAATDSGTTELLEHVRQIFAQRPVLQMTALVERIGEAMLKRFPSWKLLEVIRSVSYFCVDGPFRNTHVQFGFDPRKDPAARFYQSIDFRDPWFKNRSVRRAQATDAIQGNLDLDNDLDEDEQGVVDCHFLIPPVKRSQCYQLGDIEDSVIQTLLRTSPVTSNCSFKAGWFSEDVIEVIRGQLKIRAEELRKKQAK